MVLVRRLPYRTHLGFEHQMRDLQRLMSALADQSDQASSSDGAVSLNPAADVYQEDDRLMLDFELPGVDIENDVHIDVHDGVLTVSGERTSERSEDSEGSYLRERRVGRFSRSLSLPDGVDADSIEANYDDGVLKISVPLPEDAGPEQPRRVEINRGSTEPTTKSIDSGDANEKASGQNGSEHHSEHDSKSKSKSKSKKNKSKKEKAKSSS